MEPFYLVCTLAVPACTTVEAETLEAAIEIAKDREVWVESGDEYVEWIAQEIHGTIPEEIRKLGQGRAPAEMPILHAGGTGAERLFEDYANAVSAIRVALRDLPEPSERDYAVKGPGSFARAMDAHERRVIALEGMLDDLQAVMDSIASQRDAVAHRPPTPSSLPG